MLSIALSLFFRIAAWLAVYLAIAAIAAIVPIVGELLLPGNQKVLPADGAPDAVTALFGAAVAGLSAGSVFFAIGVAISTRAQDLSFIKRAKAHIWDDLARFATIGPSFFSAILFIAGLIPDLIFSFSGLICLVIGTMIFFPSIWLKRYAARQSALSATEILVRDGRAPVLYLRAFKDDAIMKHRSIPDLVRPLLPGRVMSEDEQLAKALEPVGPMIAIGDPGAEFQNLGAAYNVYSDDEWQDAVRDFIKRAALIIIRVSDTDFVYWEINQALELKKKSQIWFLISDPGSGYAFRKRFEEATSEVLSLSASQMRKETYSSIRSIVSFNCDERPVITKVERLPFFRNHLTALSLNQFRAAFSKIHPQITPPPLNPLTIAAVLWLVAMPFLTLML